MLHDLYLSTNVIQQAVAAQDKIIKKVMEMYGDTQSEAAESIQHSDEARAAYYKNTSGLLWGDVHNYDLSIDSSIGTQECAEAICGYIMSKQR